MSITINTREGLCNQIRTMFSYINLAHQFKMDLKVIWTNYNKCNGFFLNYFIPIPNVIIEEYLINKSNRFIDMKNNKNTITLNMDEIKKISKSKKNFVYRGYFPHNDFHPNKIFIYKTLHLNKIMKKNVIENINKKKTKGFIALHIRRTDLVTLHKIEGSEITSDQEFIDFINQYPKLDIFLATDNYKTQKKFIELFPKRIFFSQQIEKKQEGIITKRGTSLEISIIDLFTCVNSDFFLGTNKSSFTDIIYQLRQNNHFF